MTIEPRRRFRRTMKILTILGVIFWGITYLFVTLIGGFFLFRIKQDFEILSQISLYGFPVALGFASACFSWARNLDEFPKNLFTLLGGLFFYSSIAFLVSAFFTNLFKAKKVNETISSWPLTLVDFIKGFPGGLMMAGFIIITSLLTFIILYNSTSVFEGLEKS